MAPQPVSQGPAYIAELAGRVEILLGELRKLEGAMRVPPGPHEIEMPVLKAETSLSNFEGWVAGVARKHGQEQKKLQHKARVVQLTEQNRSGKK